MLRSLITLCMAFWLTSLDYLISLAEESSTPKPNILFVAMDDLNDWIGCLGGHPQALTPNLDRLSQTSVFFTNAHCAAPACNPSRAAVFTGISPNLSGLYSNNQSMRAVMPTEEIIPKTFMRHGYHASGSGKMLHYFIDAASWNSYFPNKETENPFPRTLYPNPRPLSLPRGGPWQYVETDWGPLDATDEEYGGDYLVTNWVNDMLSSKHDKPFFLACGIYRPHEPWFVPAKYFEPFPLESIQLPPGYKEDDLDDLPPTGKRRGPNRYFAHIRKEGQWKRAVQGYLASIHYADAMLGRVLDTLEASDHKDNTILVLWSDHGWHLGEKQHWQKFTAWRACTRVPLMIRTPKSKSGICHQPVCLTSLFPTLLDLAGLPAEEKHDHPSLKPLIENPKANWPHVAITHLDRPENYSISDVRWRYIHYQGDEEELYDVENDRYEWNNLANSPGHREVLEKYRALRPKSFSPYRVTGVQELKQLPLRSTEVAMKNSNPFGPKLTVTFLNKTKSPVNVHWIDQQGKPVLYFQIEAGQAKSQLTRQGATWMITRTDDKVVGHVQVESTVAKVIIDHLP